MKTFSLTTDRLSPRDLMARANGAGRLRLGGFTLVEVTLAIGIISFAFVAMFGMLPVGLNVSRQAMDTTIEAQIVQQMKTQALQTDFSQLDELGKPGDELYFDDQGKIVDADKAVYKAGYLPVPDTTLLPGGTPSSVTSKLATVTIFVLNTKGSKDRVQAGAASKDAKKFTILIPDNGL